MDLIINKYKKESEFLIAGTSAGAMAMSEVMISGGGKEEALINSDLELSTGFRILPECIIDTHFIKRGRFARLAHAIVLYPRKLGIGLGEDTALIIKEGSVAECRGSGMVVIIDGRYINKTNIKIAHADDPIFLANFFR
jgi:cyanophycinase